MASCTHLGEIREVTPRTPNGCEECPKIGQGCVHLRLCLEPSTSTATRTTAIMRSFEPGETWGWCYIDQVQLDFA